jgi:hypothetical protein
MPTYYQTSPFCDDSTTGCHPPPGHRQTTPT